MNHPCHDSQVNRLRKIEGQVRGLQKMIEERRYCMDIVSQLRAVQGALKKVELGILETHLQHCVQDALNSRNSEDAEAKIQEILQLLQKNRTHTLETNWYLFCSSRHCSKYFLKIS